MTTPSEDEIQHLDASTRRRRRRFQVSARSESLFDALLALWSAFGADDKSQSHELGGAFFDSFHAAIPPTAMEALRETGFDDGKAWPAVLSMIASEAPAGDNDSLLEWLGAYPDVAGRVCEEFCAFGDPADVELVVSDRDPEALERLLPTVKEQARDSMRRMLSLPAEEVGAKLAGAIGEILESAYLPASDDWDAAIAASAESARHIEPTMRPQDLIERVTNGLDYTIPLGMTRMILVPTVTLRPWTLITEFGDAVIVNYSVSDDHMERDPDAAPGWLVRFHKALGDEKRLRILREVADGGAGLADLTEVLGVAKSTVFHHIGILRAAGLLRVQVDNTEDVAKVYRLRTEAFGDADTQLHKYLEVALTPKGVDR